MLALLKLLDARLGEPSTYAGIAAVLLALNVSVDPGLLHQVTLYGTIGAGVLSVLLSEAGTKPAAQVAVDVIQALAAGLKAIGPDVAINPSAPSPSAAITPPAAPTSPASTILGLAAMLALMVSVAACQVGADALTSVGVSASTAATIATDTAEAGQLFCTDGTVFMAVAGVTVTGAKSDKVADACAQAQAISALTPPATTPVPIAAPAGVQAVLAAVPAATAAAVELSKTSP